MPNKGSREVNRLDRKGKQRTCPKGKTWSPQHNECRWPDDEERQTAR